MGDTVRRSFIGTWMGKCNRECMFVCRKQGLFLSVYVDYFKMEENKQNMALMWKTLMKNVDLTNELHFLITFTWDALNVNANRTKSVLNNNIKNCLNHVFLLEHLKNCPNNIVMWETRLSIVD